MMSVRIFGKRYNLLKLQQIGQGKEDDEILEFINQDIDYICDNSTVRFYEVYRWNFKNKKTGQTVDVYVDYFPDTDTIRFSGDKKSEFIFYR